VQPVPKAIYYSGFYDKHATAYGGPLTPQSGMLLLDHCDLHSCTSIGGEGNVLYPALSSLNKLFGSFGRILATSNNTSIQPTRAKMPAMA